ncbi:MAG: ExeA family protein [Marinomonas sp.]
MAQYLQQFGLSHAPLSKGASASFETSGVKELNSRFSWLLDSPGIGLLTGEPGVGKTAALQQLCQTLSPHEYKVIYHSETDFGRIDLYRQLAMDFGLEPPFRRAGIWRILKLHIQELTQNQQRLPIWIIDEAQNLPPEFFRDFPSFVNFTFDSQPLMTVWFVGNTYLNQVLKRQMFEALRSRIKLFIHFEPFNSTDEFKSMITLAFKNAGAASKLITDSGIELIRLASQGRFRQAGQVIQTALQLAYQSNLNHIPDQTIKQAIEELQK